MTTALTIDSLTTILGRQVEEIHLTIAKSSAMGLDSETIAGSIGLDRAEVDELMTTQDYKDVRLLVGSEMLRDRTERDANWDGVESTAVEKLARRVKMENDTETLLKIAAVANRATRRTAPPKDAGPLDPSQAGHRVPLTLTRRYTEQLGADGIIMRTETQQISVLNGSAVNPKFEEVKQLLSGAMTPEGTAPEMVARTEPKAHTATSLEYNESIHGDDKYTLDELMKAARRAKR